MTSAARLLLARAIWDWRPHAGQRQWLLDTSRVKVAACGRRWGKTESEAVDAATWAIVHPGSEQMIVAPTYDQARLIANGVERLLLGSPLLRRRTEVRKTPYPLISIFGSRISARSADDDGRALRGHRADRVIVDEAAFVRDAVISDVVQPMLADSDGQLIMISTPFGRNHFWRAWAAGQGGGARVRSFQFPSSGNPHISREYIESQRLEIPERSFRAEYLAEFVDDASRVFKASEIEDCTALGRQARAPVPPRIVAGIDWARYTDFTVCVALDIARRPWRLAAMDRFQGLSWEASIERAAEFLRKWQAVAALPDSTGIGDPLNEQLRARIDSFRDFRCEVGDYSFTASSKAALIDNLVMRMAHRDVALAPLLERIANDFAPEHLCLLVADPWALVGHVRNAGGIFVGEHSFEVLGDYVAGPSHIMPTGATARFNGPVNVLDFVKVINLIGLDADTARALASDADKIASAESLSAHAAAARWRVTGASRKS